MTNTSLLNDSPVYDYYRYHTRALPKTIRRRTSYRFWFKLFNTYGNNFNLQESNNVHILTSFIRQYCLTTPIMSTYMESAIQAYKDVYSFDLDQNVPL